jgi:glycosyltransferase involved in cell wall biosynthesis
VSEHKNISFALDCFVKLKPKGEILFDIFGACEEKEYMGKIEKQIKQLPSNIKVNYKGPVPNEELKIKLQAEYHFMLFPTKGESFSHSIVDSWNSGCPVLISDQTPWLDLESRYLGWNFNLLDSTSLINSINQAVDLNQETYNNWSNNCVRFYNKNVCSEEITTKNKLIFE